MEKVDVWMSIFRQLNIYIIGYICSVKKSRCQIGIFALSDVSLGEKSECGAATDVPIDESKTGRW